LREIITWLATHNVYEAPSVKVVPLPAACVSQPADGVVHSREGKESRDAEDMYTKLMFDIGHYLIHLTFH